MKIRQQKGFDAKKQVYTDIGRTPFSVGLGMQGVWTPVLMI